MTKQGVSGSPATAEKPVRRVQKQAEAPRLPEAELHQIASDAVIWAMPIVSFDAMRQAFFRDAHARYYDIAFWSRPADWRMQLTTPNTSVLYVYFNFNTLKGPVIVEIPPVIDTGLFGSILDAWQTPLADVGPAGVDAGKGGKFLLLPPDFEGKPEVESHAIRLRTFNGCVALRVVPQAWSDVSVEKAITFIRGLRAYPLSQAGQRLQQRFIDMSGKLFDGIVRFDVSFFESLARMLHEEPPAPRDAGILHALESLGISKDKQFTPDAATRGLLSSAALEAQASLIGKESNDGSLYWPDGTWRTPSTNGADTGFTFEKGDVVDVQARGLYSFMASAPPTKLGRASTYLATWTDASHQPLDGDAIYRLRVPARVPAKQFWSLTVYDVETCAFVQDSKRIELSSLDARLQRNQDGSVDIFFGPSAPPGRDANWISTGGARRWFAAFRFYGPGPTLLDKSWRLPDIEPAVEPGAAHELRRQ